MVFCWQSEEGVDWLCGAVVTGVHAECTRFRILAPAGRTLVLRVRSPAVQGLG